MSGLKDKVIFGGLYKVLHNKWNNDQSYGLAVPIIDGKGNLYMQDTYQISSPSMNKGESKFEACVRRMMEFGDGENYGVLNNARWNYYHKNQERIFSEQGLNGYELIADLHDYREAKGEDDWKDYKPEDVIHGVKLYFEHGYSLAYGPVGITVVRKSAIKDNVRILNKCTENLKDCIRLPYSRNYEAEKVCNALKSVEDNEENHKAILEAKLALKMHEKIREMYDEYDEFFADAKRELGLYE